MQPTSRTYKLMGTAHAVKPLLILAIISHLIVGHVHAQFDYTEFDKSLQLKVDSILSLIEADSTYIPQIDYGEPIPREIPNTQWENLLAEKIALVNFFRKSKTKSKTSIIINSIMPEDIQYSPKVGIWWHKVFADLLMVEADFPGAIRELEVARDLALNQRDRVQLYRIERMKAFTYHYMGNDVFARQHFQKVVDDYGDVASNDYILSAYMLVELDCELEDLESAKENLKIFEEPRLNDDPEYFKSFSSLAYATYYLSSQKCDSALYHFENLLEIYLERSDLTWHAWLMSQVSLSHTCSGDLKKAIEIGNKGLELSLENNFFKEELDNREALYQAYLKANNTELALLHLQKVVELRKHIGDAKKSIAIANTIMQNEYKRQAYTDSLLRVEEERVRELEYTTELNRERNRRNIFLFASALVVLLSVGLWSRLRYIRKTKNAIEFEKERSEKLLLNILPEKVAAELKEKGETEARLFEETTVIFTDFQGFTSLSEKLSPSELVHEINVCFRAFDGIVEKHKIEKIKTIGDSYMAAGGLHIPRKSEARDVVNAALEMQEFMKNRKALREDQGEVAFQMRVGIHTGAVVAGVVGMKKFQYDIWGDAVNTASRIESCGEIGKVNISKATYELIKNDKAFQFNHRGMVNARGKGDLEMIFVSRSARA